MPLLPMFSNDPWYYYHHRPSKLINQHFGVGLKLEDLLAPLSLDSLDKNSSSYLRPWMTEAAAEDHGSTIHNDKDKFEITLDVKQFAPEEITVKTIGQRCITVEGQHEEKEDDHGIISRHFIRRYFLPEGHDMMNVESQLHSDGILTITAPKLSIEESEHRPIEIQHTGKPLKAISGEEQ